MWKFVLFVSYVKSAESNQILPGFNLILCLQISLLSRRNIQSHLTLKSGGLKTNSVHLPWSRRWLYEEQHRVLTPSSRKNSFIQYLCKPSLLHMQESQGYFAAEVFPFLFHIFNFILLFYSCQCGLASSRFSIQLLAGTVVSACRAGDPPTTAAGGCCFTEGYPFAIPQVCTLPSCQLWLSAHHLLRAEMWQIIRNFWVSSNL